MNIRIGVKILNCRNYKNTDRGHADLPIRITPKGGKLLNMKPGQYTVQYSNGPIPDLSKSVADWDGKATPIAVYAGTLGGPKQRTMGDIYGLPAIVFATYGKGSVVSCGPHPEKYEATYPIALGMIHALTGVKCTYEFQSREPRPIRVAYYTRCFSRKNSLYGLVDLFKCRKLDVLPGQDFGRLGSLEHADVLVLPDSVDGVYPEGEMKSVYIRRFLDRGGIVIGFGEGSRHLPAHPNCRTAKDWKQLRTEILKCFK